ncbi:hypothetical protein ACVME8_001544 [Bradyrhizobium diazoefficiens]
MEFDVAMLKGIVSGKPEAFPQEHNIRMLQFRTWLLFPDEGKIVDAIGRLAATYVLQQLESEKRPARFGRRKDCGSRTLIGLLKDKAYATLYDAFFSSSGWTALLNQHSVRELDKQIEVRKGEVDTVCDMIDFRFRAVEHGSLPVKKAHIAAGELYVWAHPKPGKPTWRTIRKRWAHLKLSAPFLYASEKLGFDFLPAELDGDDFGFERINRKKLKRFLGQAQYVSDKIEHASEEDWDSLSVTPERPNSAPLRVEQMAFMNDYRQLVSRMRLE